MKPARTTRSLLGNGLALLALCLLAWWLLGLQHAPWPAPTPLAGPRWTAALAALAWLLLCGWIARPARAKPGTGIAAASDWLVAYASQTGFALELAERTADALRRTGIDVALRDIATLEPTELAGKRCLFVASTTGEGDPPDHALHFAGSTMRVPADLRELRYAVLALGDRTYASFCAFGRQLDGWLHASGAQPLFDRVEVDNADPGALRHWQTHVGLLAGHTDLPDWTRPQYQPWTLRERRLLNPGSAGGPAFHIALAPPAGDAAWQAGDIAEIGPRNAPADVAAFLAASGFDGDAEVAFQDERGTLAMALARARLPSATPPAARTPAQLVAGLQPLPHREYSIASIPADGTLQLLVRLMQRDDGSPGIGSGWLCAHAGIGDAIDLRIRANPNFHGPQADRPMILIGNGTGLAGLRAHLKARAAAGATRNWLLFGERNAAADRFHGAELDEWLRDGTLERLDLVFSRDGGAHRYVQDALRDQAELLHAWLDAGASLYVCGSLEGMAPGVDAALVDALGQDRVDALLQAGRYRRDVY